MVAPLFGTYLIKVKVTDETGSKKDDMYQSRFYVIFRSVLKWCLTHKAVVIAATAGVFAASVVLMDHVHQEFFPLYYTVVLLYPTATVPYDLFFHLF